MIWAVVGVALAAGALLVFLVDPAIPGFFPPCPFRAATGYYCAGCGAMRGTHRLLHGDVLAAVRYNPLLFLSLPFLTVAVGFEARRVWSGEHPWRRLSPWAIYAIAVLIIAYWILRNVPTWPFTMLAP